MNNIILVGRLTRDVELLETKNNDKYCRITMAVNRNFKNSNGEYEVDFINCVLWSKLAINLEKFASKGTSVAIKGRLSVNKYENEDGNNVTKSEVVVESLTVLK